MVESRILSPAEVEEEHGEESRTPYLYVWLTLVVLLGLEYLSAFFFKDYLLVLMITLVSWVMIQAATIGWWFMHLKFEGAWAYWLILAAVVLSMIVVLALVPDIAFRASDSGVEMDAPMSSVLNQRQDQWVNIVSR